MEEKAYKEKIIEMVENIHNVIFLRKIYTLLVCHMRRNKNI